jgi:LCP family protein required for cell wall assembly
VRDDSAARGERPPAQPPHGRSHRTGGSGRRTARTLHGALGLTVLGTILPGTAYLAAGRRKLGAVTLVLFLLLVAGGVYLATTGRHTVASWAVSRSSLIEVIVGAGAIALLWMVVVVTGYRMLVPRPMGGVRHAVGALVVLVLAAVVAAPAVQVGRIASAQSGFLSGVFGHHRSATVVDRPDPFAGKARVNVLLLGGDSGPDRDGLRTDTVVVASIDTHTGDTTLFSLPRNLENLPFPPGSALAKAYPDGFTAPREDEGLLNAVYRNGPGLHPGIIGPSDNPGADWLKLGVGQALGLHIDYYALVNMAGFSKVVDALGGIRVNINYWVPIGGVPDQQLPDDYFRPGPNQHLDGWHALQYARGRYGLSDYLRMDRQRCMLDAVVKAADPAKVLASYPEIAASAESTLQTDIPESALQGFVDLGFKAKDAQIRSVVFDAQVINPAYPDYDKIHSIVARTLSSGRAAGPDGISGAPSAAASSSAAPSTGTPSTGATPTGATSSAGAVPIANVANACAYNPTEAQKALAQGEPPTKNR